MCMCVLINKYVVCVKCVESVQKPLLKLGQNVSCAILSANVRYLYTLFYMLFSKLYVPFKIVQVPTYKTL